MLKEIIKIFFGQSDKFEPEAVRRMRRYYLIFSYMTFFLYFGYIIHSVAKAPTVISLDEDLSHPHDAQIPNVYISYDRNISDYNPNLIVDCILSYNNNTYDLFPSCNPWLKVDPNPEHYYGYIFKVDYNSIRFGNDMEDSEDSITYVNSILFLINFTTPSNLNSSDLGYYRGDFVFLNFVDPEYDITSEAVNNAVDEEYKYYILNENSITLNPNEYVYVRFSRTILTALNTANDWLNRVGIYRPSSNNTKTTLNVLSEYHQNTNLQATSVLMLFPSTYIVMKQKETYTLTFISAIGSLSTLTGVFGTVGFFLFGSKRLQAFGYLHWPYSAQYKRLLYRGNNHVQMTFEDAIESLGQGDQDAVTDIGNRESINDDPLAITSPFGLSGPELQIQILSTWFS